MRSLLYGVALAALLGSGGCAPRHLAYVHDANVGIALGAAPTEGHVQLSFGYDRDLYAIVPRKGNGGKDKDAMSVTAVSEMEVRGLDEVRFKHVIATGKPAVKIAADQALPIVTAKQKVFSE